MGAVMEQVPCAHALMLLHTAQMCCWRQGRAGMQVAQEYFRKSIYEARVDQKSHCFEEILTCALAKGD